MGHSGMSLEYGALKSEVAAEPYGHYRNWRPGVAKPYSMRATVVCVLRPEAGCAITDMVLLPYGLMLNILPPWAGAWHGSHADRWRRWGVNMAQPLHIENKKLAAAGTKPSSYMTTVQHM
jgi:hypothetical protein